MKIAGFLATVSMASVLTATAAQADSLAELRVDILDFKTDYIASLQEAVNATYTNKDNTESLAIVGGVETGCGSVFEAIQTPYDFLDGCLETVLGSKELLAADMKDVFDDVRYEELKERLVSLRSDGETTESEISGDPELETANSGADYKSVYEIIDTGCSGDFLAFDTLTSPQCVAAQTQSMVNIANFYNVAAEGNITEDFKASCLNVLSIAPNPVIDPHGPWFNELWDVTTCLDEMAKSYRRHSTEILSEDIKDSFDLVANVIKAYEYTYKVEYPNEDWGPVPPRSVAEGLNNTFDR